MHGKKIQPTPSGTGHLLPPPYSPTAPPLTPTAIDNYRSPSPKRNLTVQSGSYENSQPLTLYPPLPVASGESTQTMVAANYDQSQNQFQQPTPFGGHNNNGYAFNAVPQVQNTQPVSTVSHLQRLPPVPELKFSDAHILQMCPNRQRVTCPHCKVLITTFTTYSIGMLSHLTAIAACSVSCGLCTCIPYCINKLKDVEHHCPYCGRIVGHYRRLGFM